MATNNNSQDRYNQLRMAVKTELKTIQAMIGLFCKASHRSATLCEDCSQLLRYAKARLAACPFRRRQARLPQVSDPLLPSGYEREDRGRHEVLRASNAGDHPVLALKHLLAEKIPRKAGRSRRA